MLRVGNDHSLVGWLVGSFVRSPFRPVQTQDCLLARVRTSGIVEERYEIDGATFCIFDVGGQRNERKKVRPTLRVM